MKGMMQGIWITGVGALSAAGTGAPALRSLLSERRSALATQPFSYWSVGRCPTPPRVRAAHLLDRSARLFAAAAEEAWQGAGFAGMPAEPSRCDVIEGSSLVFDPNNGELWLDVDAGSKGVDDKLILTILNHDDYVFDPNDFVIE